MVEPTTGQIKKEWLVESQKKPFTLKKDGHAE